jgi:hypothetical protein
MPQYWGQTFPWNPATPSSPGEAAWSHAWQPPQVHAKGLPWSGQANESYRWFEPDVREYYEANPTQAYQGFLDYGFGGQERPLLQYARNFYGRAYAAAMRGEEGADAPATGQVAPPTQGAHWTDYLTPQLVYAIRESFQAQSPSAKGYAIQWMPTGRNVNGY